MQKVTLEQLKKMSRTELEIVTEGTANNIKELQKESTRNYVPVVTRAIGYYLEELQTNYPIMRNYLDELLEKEKQTATPAIAIDDEIPFEISTGDELDFIVKNATVTPTETATIDNVIPLRQERQEEETDVKITTDMLAENGKIKINQIEIERVEGKSSECGITHTAYNWEEAKQIIDRMAITAPKKGNGYDKTDFTATWADGSEYKGRFDLQSDVDGYYINNQILDQFLFDAGFKKPDSWKEGEYLEFVKPNQDKAVEALKKFDIPKSVGRGGK